MPLYDYDCAACGRRFEVIHGVHADGPTACPACGSGPVRKAIQAPAVHFKGSGWAKKERRATVSPGGPKVAGEGSASSSDHEPASKSSEAGDAPAKTVPAGDASTSSGSAGNAAASSMSSSTSTTSKDD